MILRSKDAKSYGLLNDGRKGVQPVAAYYAYGALGMGSLDTLNRSSGNAQATNRGCMLQAQGWRAQAMLLESQPLYRTLRIAQWSTPGADANVGKSGKSLKND